MRQILSQLLHLQELDMVLDEARILNPDGDGDQTAAVEEEVKRLRAEIDPTPLKRYDKLRQTGPAVTHEQNGVCNACRLTVPQGDLNRMARGAIPWECPHCGRFLLLAERT